MRPILPVIPGENKAQRGGVSFLKSHRKAELDQNFPIPRPEFLRVSVHFLGVCPASPTSDSIPIQAPATSQEAWAEVLSKVG